MESDEWRGVAGQDRADTRLNATLEGGLGIAL